MAKEKLPPVAVYGEEPMNEMIEAGDLYSRWGWVLNPLSDPADLTDASPGKRPILSGWQKKKLKETRPKVGIYWGYTKENHNMGLLCGSASNVDAFDLDSEIFRDELLKGIEINTLISAHRSGRGHILFQHEEGMFSEKHHFIGIEYFGNNKEGAGSNLVLPPSIHHSGEKYTWNVPIADLLKLPAAPIMKMTARLKDNWLNLCKRESELHEYFKKCRHCFTKGSNKHDNTDARSKGLWDRPDDISLRGTDGRQATLSMMGELKAAGCPNDLLHMACKRFFGRGYDYAQTEKELQYIKPIHSKCKTLRQYLNVECGGCTWKPEDDQETKKDPSIKEMGLSEILALNAKEKSRHLEISLPEDHFITQYVKWLASKNDGYNEYRITCALWVQSALTGGKVSLKLKQGIVKPNLWINNLGKTTYSRKSAVVNESREIYEVATDTVLYNDDYSIEGYLETLAATPILNNVRDEVAGLIAKFHKKYNEGIFELECAIYDGQNIKKTLSSGKNKTLKTYVAKNPFVTKLYATTPENFSRYMTIDDFLCGYGFRFLYTLPDYKKDRMPLTVETQEDIEAWASILARIKKLKRFFDDSPGIKFSEEPGAMEYYDKVMEQLEKAAEASNNDMLNAAIGRGQAHILKIAMLIELGKAVPSTVITAESIKIAAGMVVNYFIPTIMQVIDRLQEDIRTNNIEKITSILRQKGGVMQHSRLLHDCKIERSKFSESIATMIESDTIELIKDKKTGLGYYRLLIRQDSGELQVPTIPKILQIHQFSQGDNSRENLENSKELEKCIEQKTIRVPASRVKLLKESENLENLENRENSKDLSMQDKARILTDIRNERYGASHPDDPYATKEYFESELIIRCAGAKSAMSRDEAKTYVTDAFISWGWT
jgi:hypothetical protein